MSICRHLYGAWTQRCIVVDGWSNFSYFISSWNVHNVLWDYICPRGFVSFRVCVLWGMCPREYVSYGVLASGYSCLGDICPIFSGHLCIKPDILVLKICIHTHTFSSTYLISVGRGFKCLSNCLCLLYERSGRIKSFAIYRVYRKTPIANCCLSLTKTEVHAYMPSTNIKELRQHSCLFLTPLQPEQCAFSF